MAQTTTNHDFDAELAAFLEWRAEQVAGAPTAIEVSRRIAHQAGVRARPRPTFARTAWVFVAFALSLALVGAAAWIASRPPVPVTTSTSPYPSSSGLSSPVARVQPTELAGTVAVAVGRGDLVAINPLTGRTTNLVICDSPCNGLSSPTWSPDGTRVAYEVPVLSTDGFAAPRRGIWIKDMLTGASTLLVPCAQPADCELDRPLAWSPDGNWIAFFQGTTLSIAPVDGGPVRTVTDVGQLDSTIASLSVSWSPDSRRLDYTTQSGQWESVNLDGSDHQVHPVPLFVWLEVSPDENQIAYVTEDATPAPEAPETPLPDPFTATLWTAQADGSNARQIASLPGCCLGAWVGAPAWSTDGSQLAWAGYDGQDASYSVLIAGGSQEEWRLASVSTQQSRPAWAPGPTPISSNHLIPTPEPLPTLVPHSSVEPSNCPAMDTITDWIGATDDLPAPRSAAPPGQPSNGVIVAGLVGNVGIDEYVGQFAADFAQGASPNKLFYTASNGGWSAMSDFAWSPDGSEFAFAASDGIDPDAAAGGGVTFSCGTLFAASSDGTSPHRLLPPAAGYGAMAPAWSPDGTRIAYLSYQAPAGAALAEPPVFRAMRVLDLRDGLDQAIGPCSGCTALEWSPDGGLIAGFGPTSGGIELVSGSSAQDRSSAGATRVLDGADAVRWVGQDLLAASVVDGGSKLSVDRVHTAAKPYLVDSPQVIAAPPGSTLANGTIAFDASGERLAVAVRNGTFDPAAQVQLGTVDVGTGQFKPANDARYADAPSNVLWSPDGTQLLFEGPIGVLERDHADGSGSSFLGAANVVPGHHGEAWQPVWP